MRISETKVVIHNIVHYQQCNFLGRLHGGDMLKLFVDAGMISSMKVARGKVVLAELDNVVFKKGINLGDIIRVEAEVDYVGKSSLEVQMMAFRGEELMVSATGVYVKVDEYQRPVEVQEKVKPIDESEVRRYEEAVKRRERRVRDVPSDIDETEGLRCRETNTVYVSPELTYDGERMSAGRLLKFMDDLAGSLGLEFIGYSGHSPTSDATVTVAVSEMGFYSPVRLGDIIQITSGIVYVGKTSIGTLANVFRYNPEDRTTKKVTKAYMVFVRIGPDGKPKEMPTYSPSTDVEKELWEEFIRRREYKSR
ncbi:acyl-CoA thioesterase [Acidianus sp. DSM 29099]|nr:hotdog domain-containing protein [Acidianus sp. RZ1]NON62764.1 acyl-CoA thioesterase [Acidianus sp. RZ1]